MYYVFILLTILLGLLIWALLRLIYNLKWLCLPPTGHIFITLAEGTEDLVVPSVFNPNADAKLKHPRASTNSSSAPPSPSRLKCQCHSHPWQVDPLKDTFLDTDGANSEDPSELDIGKEDEISESDAQTEINEMTREEDGYNNGNDINDDITELLNKSFSFDKFINSTVSLPL